MTQPLGLSGWTAAMSRREPLLEPEAAYAATAAELPAATGAEMAFVGVPDGEDRIVLRHSVHAATTALDGVVIPAGWGLGGKVLASKEPHWVSDYPRAGNITHLPQVDSSVAAEGLHAIVGVPIVHEDRFLGVLYAGDHTVNTFSDSTIDAMVDLARRGAALIVLAERIRRSADQAILEERRRVAKLLYDSVGARLESIEASVRGLVADTSLDRRLRLRLEVLEHQADDASARLRLSLQTLNSTRRPVTRPTPHGLTPREFDVLRRVALGERNAEIAAAIHLSRNTVKSYLQSACEKLGARNRVEAVARAAEAGLF